MRGVAVKGAERGAERLFVKRQRLHRVARGCHARGRRRGEDRLGGRLAAVDVVRLEQFDGQVRNLLRRAHLFGADARECEILPVGGACDGLTAECLQGRPGESRVVRDAEYVVWGDHFHKDTNKRGQKQVYLLFAEREYLRHSQSTNKPREKSKLACIFSEAEYLKDSAMEKERTVSNPDCGRPGKRSRHPESAVTAPQPKIGKRTDGAEPGLPAAL